MDKIREEENIHSSDVKYIAFIIILLVWLRLSNFIYCKSHLKLLKFYRAILNCCAMSVFVFILLARFLPSAKPTNVNVDKSWKFDGDIVIFSLSWKSTCWIDFAYENLLYQHFCKISLIVLKISNHSSGARYIKAPSDLVFISLTCIQLCIDNTVFVNLLILSGDIHP